MRDLVAIVVGGALGAALGASIGALGLPEPKRSIATFPDAIYHHGPRVLPGVDVIDLNGFGEAPTADGSD